MKKKAAKPFIVGVIPARMGSTRFPGKPLAKIGGKAMIYHVHFRSKRSRLLDDLYIATPDKEIKEYCQQHAMNVVMTKASHQRCSDRTAEAMLKIEKALKKKISIVVMIQGDEPMLTPQMISAAVKPLIRNSEILVSNLVAPINTVQEFEDPNEVKVVCDKNNYAVYFSREPIPSRKKGAKSVPMLKQVCIIPFKRNFLLTFNKLKETPLECIESVDMLRCLEYGYKVKMVPTKYETYSVDTVEDLRKVNRLMKKEKKRRTS